MNVRELRKQVERALSLSLDNEEHRATFLARLNTRYARLMVRHQWTFRRRTVPIYWPADRTYYEVDGLTDGNNFLTVTGAFSSNTVYSYMPAWEQGGVFDLSSITAFALPADGPGIAEAPTPLGYYKVEGVEVSGSDLKFWMEPRWPPAPPRFIPDESSVVLRVHRILLPWDCESILGITDPDNDRGPLIPVGSGVGLALQLKELDDTGDPVYYMATYGERGAGPAGEDHYPEYLRREQLSVDAPIDVEFSASTPASGAGSMRVGTYDFCYTWEWGGIESGPSKVVTVELGTAGFNFNLESLELYANGYQGARKRHVYWRFEESPWARLTTITDPTVGALDVGSLLTNGWQPRADDVDYPRRRHGRQGRLPVFLRVWPRPSSDIRLFLTYLSAPAELEWDGDVPECPGVLQDVLWREVVIDYIREHPGNEGVSVAISDLRGEIKQDMAVASSRWLETGPQRHTRRSAFRNERDYAAGFYVSPLTFTRS